MYVELLKYTDDPERVVALAARLCYTKSSIGELKNNLSDEYVNRLVQKIISLGHLSVLEHASFSFGIEGISRATSHQLVRHRIASYSQQSQRYVEYDNLEIVLPPSL
jgi:thymidylate synthase (FAD)